MRAFIERIDIYPEKPDNGCWIRNIVFNFPMPVQGKEIKSLLLESKSTVDAVLFNRYTEHLTCGSAVDILTFCKYLGAPGLTGKKSQDA